MIKNRQPSQVNQTKNEQRQANTKATRMNNKNKTKKQQKSGRTKQNGKAHEKGKKRTSLRKKVAPAGGCFVFLSH